VLQHLPSKFEDLNSNPSTIQKNTWQTQAWGCFAGPSFSNLLEALFQNEGEGLGGVGGLGGHWGRLGKL
jgi:hypothetical protein